MDAAATAVALVAQKGIQKSGDDPLMKGHAGDASIMTKLRQGMMLVKAKRRMRPNPRRRGKGKGRRKHIHKETKVVKKATILLKQL